MDLTIEYATTLRPDDLTALFAPVRPELTHTPAGLDFLGVIRRGNGAYLNEGNISTRDHLINQGGNGAIRK